MSEKEKSKKTVITHFYNEEFLLPWWLEHHKRIFDHGILIDYASTDRSCDIIREICPTWEIRPSRNEFFHAHEVDLEVMDIERELDGWRIALNVTEFLYGNIGQLDNCAEENKQFLIGNCVFVDMEDADKGPLLLDHTIPLHEQRYWGYIENNYQGFQNGNGTTRRLCRSIHNYPLEYPDWGRHFPDKPRDFDDLMIFYYGWAYIGQEGIDRKLQIKTKLPPGQFIGCHHDKPEDAMINQYRGDQQPVSSDLRAQIRPILAHNYPEYEKYAVKPLERFMYKYNDTHLKYMLEQQHEVQASDNIEMYADLSVHEFSQFQPYIGHPKVVMDAGCGTGRGAVYLNHLLSDDSVEYILADRTGWQWDNASPNLHDDNSDIYNDLAVTADFCQLNGIKQFRTFDTELDDWSTLPRVDLVISLCSFGMHVKIEKYIDRLLSVASRHATMIFGTRPMYGVSYTAESFKDRFEEVIFLPGKPSPAHQEVEFPHEDWLILRNPRV